MRIVKSSTALGKRLIQIGQKYQGTFLYQVYDKWSAKKRKHGTNVMTNTAIQMVQKYFPFVHIIALVLQFHGLLLKE